MGVSGAFKGSRAEWFAEQGWRPIVHAEEDRWNLREYPDKVPAKWHICLRNELIRHEAQVLPSSRGGWVFDRDGDFWGAPVDRFPDPIAAFRWWVAQQAAGRGGTAK